MIVLNAILFAGAALIGSCVVLGAAWLLGRGKPAAVRHLIWTGAFAALLALPFAALLLPSQLIWQIGAPAAAPAITTAPVAVEPAPSFGLADVILLLTAVWLAGVLFHFFKTLYGSFGLVLLHHRSVPHIPQGIDAAPFRGLSWQLRLRTSPSEVGPLTWGVLRPVVLLPKASVTWPRERLLSVLLHEAAHVRRKDCLARLIAVAASALYWPNPLVWLAARLLRRDAESAADDAVLTAGIRPTHYAEHLVGLARSYAGVSFAALAMAERSMLNARVKAILDPAQPRCGVTTMDMLKIAALGLTMTSVLALSRPSFAETPTAEPTGTTAQAAPTVAADAVPTPAPKSLHIVRHVRVTDNVPPVPPAPDAPDAPLAPVAPPAPPADALPPLPPVPPHAMPHVRSFVHVEFSKAEKEALRQAASAEAHQAMAQARLAIANAHLDQVIANAMRQAEDALGKARLSHAEAAKAIADAHIDQVVNEAMRKAEQDLARVRIQRKVITDTSDRDDPPAAPDTPADK